MKFSSSTYLALAVATVAVQAAPVASPAANALAVPDALPAALANFDFNSLDSLFTPATVVKREDLNEIRSIISEINENRAKRELTSDAFELAELDKRDVAAFVTLISALLNSGIITDVFKTLVSDPTILASVVAIGKAVLSAVLAQGTTLLSAVWSSGVLGKVFTDFINDSALQSAIVGIIPDLLSFAEGLISTFFGSSASTTTTTGASTATGSAKKRDLFDESFNADILDKRDLLSVVESIASAISSSGIFTTVWNYIKANPTVVLGYVESALKLGLTIGTELFNYAKSSGLLATALTWLEAHGGTIIGGIAKFVAQILGVSSTASTTTTTAASTATGAAKRAIEESSALSDIQKRDLISIIESIFTAITSSGIFTTVWNYIKANPTVVLGYVESALKLGLTIGTELFAYAKSSGLLAWALTWLQAHGGTIIGGIAKFIAQILGVSTTSSASATVATTATTTPTTTAAAAGATTTNNVLASLAAVYGSTTSTTTTKITTTTAAGTYKKRRNY